MAEEIEQLEMQQKLHEEFKKMERKRQIAGEKRRRELKRQLSEARQKRMQDQKRLERKKRKEERKLLKKEKKQKQYYEDQKIKLTTYKKKLEEHIERMSLTEDNNENPLRNSDLIIAREDLGSIQESRKDTQTSDQSIVSEKTVSVLEHRMNRKPAVS